MEPDAPLTTPESERNQPPNDHRDKSQDQAFIAEQETRQMSIVTAQTPEQTTNNATKQPDAITEQATQRLTTIITEERAAHQQENLEKIAELETAQVPITPVNVAQSSRPALIQSTPQHIEKPKQGPGLRTTLLLIALLLVIVVRTFTIGPTQFLSSQGWSFVLYGTQDSASTQALSTVLGQHLKVKPGTKNAAQSIQQYVDLIVSKMSLDQKIGQMMMVQFTGSTDTLDISTMITQYHIGSVILLTANGNIVDQAQLKGLTHSIQQDSATIPLIISTDQEGGAVDRLVNLDGARPSAAAIGATNDPNQARQDGVQDAHDLASYGINLNLAPVVDVDNLSTSEMHTDGRTFGDNPTTVTRMAGAYLQGLQQSGKVIGTLKHFPGLGDVQTDPHFGIPSLTRSQADLENIDWAPYRDLIQQNQVHALMVTHEIIPSIDSSVPASLSPKVVQGILRDQMHYTGVIITDSLTMKGITDTYTPGVAAAMAIEAGSDMIMGAASPNDVATMADGIKQALSNGTISQGRLDDSVRRILLLKYQMGLLSNPK